MKPHLQALRCVWTDSAKKTRYIRCNLACRAKKVPSFSEHQLSKLRKCLKIAVLALTQPSPKRFARRGLSETALYLVPSPSGRRLG
jgi:hypothetical protein